MLVHSQDMKTTRTPIDASVLGMTASELAGMDQEERAERLAMLLNQAADLAIAIAASFADDLGPGTKTVAAAGKELAYIARRVA